MFVAWRSHWTSTLRRDGPRHRNDRSRSFDPCNAGAPDGSVDSLGIQMTRIQLARHRGWRKPVNAVVVARPTKWGNPWHIGPTTTPATAVEKYRQWLVGEMGGYLEEERQRLLGSLHELRDRDLACWCPLDEPCHADVLIQMASGISARN